MNLRKPLFFLVAAVAVALAIGQFWQPLSYGEQLILIQSEQALAPIDKRILREPLEVQSVLLDYADDRELVLQAWLALTSYPDKARPVLLLYGAEPEFREILKRYGGAVIPPIQYFLENDLWSVKARDYSAKTIESFADSAKILWERISGNAEKTAKPAAPPKPGELGPLERGWYAVNFIKEEGQHFIGQFVVDNDSKVKWNQTDRIVQGVSSFFTSGIRTLEAKYDLGEDVTNRDYFWAGLDVAVIALPFKLLRAGKAVETSGKALPLTTRTRLFAPRLVSKAAIFQKVGKYGALAATIYIVAAHPSLINSLLGELAGVMGLPPWLVQFAGWALIVTVVLYPFSWLLKLLAQATLGGLAWLERSARKTVSKRA